MCLQNVLKHDSKCAICREVKTKKLGPNGNMHVIIKKYTLRRLRRLRSYCNQVHTSPWRSRTATSEPLEVRYAGDGRKAYLPDDEESRKVLRLHKKAWKMKLTFIVGNSLTAGSSNVITWNDIHHKNCLYGGPYKYPDSSYLDLVTADMIVLGIKLDD